MQQFHSGALPLEAVALFVEHNIYICDVFSILCCWFWKFAQPSN